VVGTMPNLILDTNVFYNLGSGSLTLATIRGPSDTLFYSPLSVLELAGKWSSRSFPERKAAAQAILTSGATELPDPDTFLTRDIFAYEMKRPPVSLIDAVKAMAASREMGSLVSGVEDYTERVVRRVSVAKAEIWRQVIEGKWKHDMLSIQRREIPRFDGWYRADPASRRQQVPRLRGAAKDAFINQTRHPGWNPTLVVNCHRRALMGARKNQSIVATTEAATTVNRAVASLTCYCSVYTQYLLRLLTHGALPEENDSGDLELFLYSTDDDHVVATSEKKWKRMADAAGFGTRVRLLA
jgi:hypothetical protein